MIGKTLLHYQVTARIGAGGMGEVYRATDTKLGREVAVKVLATEVAQSEERLTRFRREARVLAALNHPGIASIYGLEEADGQHFLVMELAPGEDLRQRLERGPIPVEEAVEIAGQIADALEEAHQKGIVHRDLKPANVKIAPDGRSKVLDFGLAKAWVGDGPEEPSVAASTSESPTLARSVTHAGAILGTAAYMSPEQARGRPVDERSDIWAFGVLFWEMLTGRTLFTGETVTDVLAAIVKEEPDLEALPRGTPPAARWVIERCLRKDPRRRLPDIGVARLELHEGRADHAHEPGADASAEETIRTLVRQRRSWAAVALAAVSVAALLAYARPRDPGGPPPLTHMVLDPPEGWSFGTFGTSRPVPSPDGRHIAIRLRSDDMATERLWLRSLDSPVFRPLTGTEGLLAGEPFWSPDSRFVGFLADGDLRTVDIADGTVRTVCPLPAALARYFHVAVSRYAGGAAWHVNGVIIFGAIDLGGLYSVAASGGEPSLVVEADAARGEESLLTPRLLPDGRLLFDAVGGRGASAQHLGTFAASLDAPSERRLVASGLPHLEVAGTHVVFDREGTLLAQRFDAKRIALVDDAKPVASSLATLTSPYRGAFGVSAGGTLAYLSAEQPESRFQLTWVNRTGEPLGTLGPPGFYTQIVLSPDETRLAMEVGPPPEGDIWVMDVPRGVASRVTSDPAYETDPIWSPDSRELVFGRVGKTGTIDLFRTGLQRGEEAVPLLESRWSDFPGEWTPDGETVLFARAGPAPARLSIWALPLVGDTSPLPLVTPDAIATEPRLTRDGRLLAYLSDESGGWEVYLEPYRRPGERVRVSVDGGSQPKWRADGEELFYRKPSGPVMAVAVREVDGGIEAGLPVELFDAGEWGTRAGDHYAVSADGQRFLVKVPLGERELRMHVLVGWESLLEPEE